jgi:hypothetical protein
VFVVDPEQLAPEKDPDAFVRRYGVDAWAARRDAGVRDLVACR